MLLKLYQYLPLLELTLVVFLSSTSPLNFFCNLLLSPSGAKSSGIMKRTELELIELN